MTSPDDTIAAPASAPGAAPRAIVRVSGPGTQDVLGRCFLPDDPDRWRSTRRPARHAGRILLRAGGHGVAGAVCLWPTDRSYTGAPLAEIHLPGSPPLVESLLATLYAAGARPAQAGEFTLRAFLAGRIDLLQAEGVLGVIEADDHVQLRRALGQLAGGISRRIETLREQLLLHLADLEAGLDFVEEDIEFVSREELLARLDDALTVLASLRQTAESRLQSTGRCRVVLAGLPNAGKSTLFNALLGSDTAIVSPRPGTTRDILTAPATWEGVPLELCDTAGWDAAAEALAEIDRAAGQRRQQSLAGAELVLWCTAADLPDADRVRDDELRTQLPPAVRQIGLQTKCDAAAADSLDPTALAVSAQTGEGVRQLRTEILRAVGDREATRGELLLSTAARCSESLRLAESALTAARDATRAGAGDELIAVDLRAGLDHLGMICGAVYTDDLLDRIFSRFCIGK